MSMRIRHNAAAMRSLTELKKNRTRLAKDLKKVAGGEKITGAGDGASEYAISERMRAGIRGLTQNIQNVKTGRSLLRVAAGGIENIVDELRSLKELAINAANDHNTDFDRATLQKEFDQRKANIDCIAATTNYNGKLLLDGRYALHKKQDDTSGVPKQPAEPSGTAQIITGNTTITADGVYKLAASCANCTIDIQAANVKLIGSGSRNDDVLVKCRQATNLWLEDYNVRGTGDATLIDFQGAGDNTLNLLGDNTLDNDTGVRNYTQATVHTGGDLTIFGSGSLTIKRFEWTYGAVIGSHRDENDNTSDITVQSGTLNLRNTQVGAAIGAGSYGSIGDITINGGTIDAVAGGGTPAIGTGRAGGHVGRITINGGDIKGEVSGRNGQNTATIGASSGATIEGLTLRGGKMHIENLSDGNAIEPEYNPPGTYSNGHNVYDQDLPDYDPYGGNLKTTPLVIHHGTKAGQALWAYINNMHTEAMGINEAKVITQSRADEAIGLIDEAISYALEESTTIGAYISRLEQTENNLVAAAENVTFSESTVRDADMAREMVAYTKDNILSQAAQSMLAQANQNLGGVLSLLQ